MGKSKTYQAFETHVISVSIHLIFCKKPTHFRRAEINLANHVCCFRLRFQLNLVDHEMNERIDSYPTLVKLYALV